MWVFVVLTAVTFFLLYWLYPRSDGIWKIKGVRHLMPLPFFGNFLANTLQIESVTALTRKLYDSFPNERYCGLYQFKLPILMIRDPELIKQIAIKDFHHFEDHNAFSSDDIDPMWSRNLFSTKGERWRNLRATLSPAFTGSKMRTMFVLMEQCAENFISYFEEKNEDMLVLNMKDIFSRFANDVIATCAFGIQCDSLRDQTNEFYMRGIEATDFSGIKNFKFFGFLISPKLMKLLDIRIFSESVGNFFKGLIRDTVTLRKEKGIVRHDMIHLLLEASKTDKHGVLSTEEDIAAQALIFFFAGFETVSRAMLFTAYELAVNPDIQERLKADVDKAMHQCGGKLTYDVLMELKYLDMVISESLRKWPGSAIDRVCTSRYTIHPENPGEKPLVLEPGDLVWLTKFAIHRDPQYYPDPDKFDPERFSDENKDKINPSTNIPFGIGPRICIGSRFALMEMKILLVSILTKFEIVPVKDTPIPIIISAKHFVPYPKGGVWLGFKRRAAT